MPHTVEMELPKIQELRADLVQEAKIKILAPQNLAKDCLSNVGFRATTKQALLARLSGLGVKTKPV